ncbi:hypothetical protein C5167_017804 [Papaver somniferum]|uniref:Uncharacterized protein n=1 Tax=Papaver somniferum TaxID=3469 RepID=A0A4Y7IPF8_PAPSO|nr:hypothetical protein C5167_017804 [Papaver somniferum]
MVQKVTKFLSSIGHHFAPISHIMSPLVVNGVSMVFLCKHLNSMSFIQCKEGKQRHIGHLALVFVLLFLLWRLHRAAQSCNCTM